MTACLIIEAAIEMLVTMYSAKLFGIRMADLILALFLPPSIVNRYPLTQRSHARISNMQFRVPESDVAPQVTPQVTPQVVNLLSTGR